MYKNQLQELAQRSCFNLPSYICIREGPDHAPRFKAAVNFNGETYESPSFCNTLRQAEHSAAEVALNALASRGPSHSLAARILDETGVYKNLLQEVSQRVGASLPMYTTFRSGHGHLPVFGCTVELAGIRFTGEPAKNKKQAEKNAAMAAWSSLKLLQQSEGSSSEKVNHDEQEHVTVARALHNFLRKAKICSIPFPIKFPIQHPRPLSTQPSPIRTSKILPLICSKIAPRNIPFLTPVNNSPMCPKTGTQSRPVTTATANDRPVCPMTAPEGQPIITTVNDDPLPSPECPRVQPLLFPAARAAPYVPVRHFKAHHRIAPPVTIRNAVPVFSAPPLPTPSQSPQLRRLPPPCVAPPVCIRQAVLVFAAPVCVEEQPSSTPPIRPIPPTSSSVPVVLVEKTESRPIPLTSFLVPVEKMETESAVRDNLPAASVVIQDLEELKI